MEENSAKKPIAARVFGWLLSSAFLVLTVLCFVQAFYEVDYSVAKKTLEVTYNLRVSALLFLLAGVGLILSLIFFVFLAWKGTASQQKAKISAIFLTVVLAGITVTGGFLYSELRSDINYRIKNTPKYTDVSIEEFLDDVNRFPKNYEGKKVSLEGVAYSCEDDTFCLRQSFYFASSEISIQYSWDEFSPRVADSDYVVVTGTVDVYYDQSSGKYTASLIHATCEIKDIR